MCWDPIWTLVLILVVPLPIQLPGCSLAKWFRMVQSLGALHLHGKPGCCSWLWIRAALDFEATLGVNEMMNIFLSVYLPFQ